MDVLVLLDQEKDTSTFCFMALITFYLFPIHAKMDFLPPILEIHDGINPSAFLSKQ